MAINIDSKELVSNYYGKINNDNVVIGKNSVGTLPAAGFSRAMLGAQLQGRVGSSTAIRPDTPVSTVRSGDTMTGIVKNFMSSQGVSVSDADAARLVQDLAQANGIANANRIYPGQRLQLGPLQQFAQAARDPRSADVSTAQSAAVLAPTGTSTVATVAANAAVPAAQFFSQKRPETVAHPVLSRTLDRAVNKGFIPANERQAVEDKILQMARDYKFAPDDFARVTLMESDGMNPKASNSRCHGIIQFCDGPDRGAASVGFAQNPKAIMSKSVLQQLDLVAKYFDDTGLKNLGSAGLDDLYLTVLTPAARQETRQQVNLNIAGNQAPQLYVNRDVRAGITRQSIQQGLHQNANERLGLDTPPTLQPVSGNVNRVQALKVSAYTNAAGNLTR